jgi:hypothetical protein
MKLNLRPVGDNAWLVYDENTRVGSLRRVPDSVRWAVTGAKGQDVDFVAGGVEAALQHIESIFSSGQLKPMEPDSDEEAALLSHFMELAKASYTLAVNTNSLASLARAALRTTALVLASVDNLAKRAALKAALMEQLDKEVERIEESSRTAEMLGSLAEALKARVVSRGQPD